MSRFKKKIMEKVFHFDLPALSLTVFFFSIFLCSSCVPKKSPSEEKSTLTEIAYADSSEGSSSATDSSDLEKLSRVLYSMSDRAKEAIPNGDPKEFLADLQRVLPFLQFDDKTSTNIGCLRQFKLRHMLFFPHMRNKAPNCFCINHTHLS